MTRQEIQDAVDAKLATLWSAVQTREDSFAAAHNGRYFQGLRTHSVIPADGVEAVADVGTKTPTDQPTQWPAAIRTASLPMALQVDCYSGPLGDGYQATVSVQIAGNVWTRTAQVGPESYRAQPWTQQVVGP